jgi:hypothetical protein
VIVTVEVGGPEFVLELLRLSRIPPTTAPATTAVAPVQNHHVPKIEPESPATATRSGVSASPRFAIGMPPSSKASR